MKSENKDFNRQFIFQTTEFWMNDLLKRDASLEVVAIWIKFKETENDIPIYYLRNLKTLPNKFLLKNIIVSALNSVKNEHKKDDSLSLLKIVFQTNRNTDKIGEILRIDLTKK